MASIVASTSAGKKKRHPEEDSEDIDPAGKRPKLEGCGDAEGEEENDDETLK